mmetsp:Transcript_758/g.1559  ORF Transcript_758/g.1559 Transcript_758/m.1559 type:complete len:183 (-) Transcript_758:443-991(-)|eukprot:CAMPEP_0113316784 /NCGR_PEP_ID=MMETSP0010_2-20120614/11936_1 /TAXON_ID=216773 ORGANISM="Corethron hystrix, Strain 308" /NCGR_SAMPLE_ID=MMETSP0010_2 /ASSEMBLY_ACC=CAM_ASM_000155 /LENGTH=182 /DNA_ID=CAMNT_0000173599 /DNA_START=269 /DNA_END=817 /DNA_ORIENTATION=- /assembly_acc=CAM_ASM_000155
MTSLSRADWGRFFKLSSGNEKTTNVTASRPHPSTVPRTPTKLQDQQQQATGGEVARMHPDNFPALPTCIKILRIVIGACYGVYLGLGNVTGASGIMIGLFFITFLPSIYVEKSLDVDFDAYGLATLQFCGVQNGLAAMILVWTTIHSYKHPAEIIADIAPPDAPIIVEEIKSPSDFGMEEEF